MKIFSSKLIPVMGLILIACSQIAHAEEGGAKKWEIYYKDAGFIINQSLPINLGNDPSKTLEAYSCIETHGLAIKYYKLMDYPIRLTVMGKDLYGIQFIFAKDNAYQIEISLYDLKIHDRTSLNDLETYFKKNSIQYTKGKDNIATYFATFYFIGEKIGLCEFRTVVLKNYGDYFFQKKGEVPWWLT